MTGTTYYLMGDKIVVMGNDGQPYPIATAEPGLVGPMRQLLRFAQAGAALLAEANHLVGDLHAEARGLPVVPCPEWATVEAGEVADGLEAAASGFAQLVTQSDPDIGSAAWMESTSLEKRIALALEENVKRFGEREFAKACVLALAEEGCALKVLEEIIGAYFDSRIGPLALELLIEVSA